MSELTFDGAWTALITPFNQDGSIDWDGFQRNINFQIAQGISGILPVGTTGESPSLDWHEHESVIDKAIEFNEGRTKLLAGTGSNSTAEAIKGSRHAHESGADAVLLVDCYYNGPSSLELRKEYYEAVLDAVPGIHVVPYIIPGRTGCEMSVEDVAILAGKYPGVHVVKEATGNLVRMAKTRALCGSDFQIMSGDDDLTVKMMSNPEIGASGVISVLSNVAPAAVEKLTRNLLDENEVSAKHLEQSLSHLFSIVGVKIQNERRMPDGSTASVVDKFRNPLPIKTLMSGLGMSAGRCRQPLGKMTRAGVEHVREVARRTHDQDPSILQPIEKAYGVSIQDRIEDDAVWKALAY
ncbi:MAG: 4-hydroxy-tetrahydrodipicolinate synthase [Planctomycetota bacterium]|nr:4-hydroxy-tetrahydrodipicolinate synthase [Planctomycetota bacterium]MDA1142081.1 4-hydroxy-tetrahydrodipicolinate synthase [Planctomycetota bacterium]